MKFLCSFIIITALSGTFGTIIYDTYTGRTLTQAEYQNFVKENTTFWCTGKYEPCNRDEGRRLDATCNNLIFPYRGGSHTPAFHVLPLDFGKDGEARKNKNGEEPMLARKQRVATLAEGSIPDDHFTAMTAHFMLFMVNSITSIHDTVNYIAGIKHCCQPEGKCDPMCNPMLIPNDDYVHQFSGVRCMNMTKPFTYQKFGCIRDKKASPERIISASHFFDLSIIYGFDNRYRAMKDGMLAYDVVDGVMWPVSIPDPLFIKSVCLQNDYPKETRCHANAQTNGLIGTNIFSIMLLRLHNEIARQLKTYNPCWEDEQLFNVARDINIAVSSQIYYYELMPEFLGKENLLKEGIISLDQGFRDLYDENFPPQATTEYVYALRWGHTIQPGMLKQYDQTGKYIKEIPTVNLTLKTGYFPNDNNFAGLTQGCFRQPMGKIDHVIEPTMAETGLGKLQYAFDVPAADLIKNGLLGIAPYVKYRSKQTEKSYTCFDDLADDFEPSYLDIIKGLYKDVEDIPLIVGIWLEKKIPGGFAPRTLYYLKTDQLKRLLKYDRHWYERPNRPNAFTERQLKEVRKATMSWLFCLVGDSVTHIQPNSFRLIGPRNPITSCKNIPKIDFSAWVDESCYMGTESSSCETYDD